VKEDISATAAQKCIIGCKEKMVALIGNTQVGDAGDMSALAKRDPSRPMRRDSKFMRIGRASDDISSLLGHSFDGATFQRFPASPVDDGTKSEVTRENVKRAVSPKYLRIGRSELMAPPGERESDQGSEEDMSRDGEVIEVRAAESEGGVDNAESIKRAAHQFNRNFYRYRYMKIGK